MQTGSAITTLMADDDPEDQLLIQEAFEENGMTNDLRFVGDGIELLDYLHQRGQYSDPTTALRPGLILLDLNMPRKDGRQALQEIKADPKLKRIPVIVLTTSQTDEDILQIYDLGCSSFITKPATFEGLVKVTKSISEYWFSIVQIPSQ